jgi:hypothetical protein
MAGWPAPRTSSSCYDRRADAGFLPEGDWDLGGLHTDKRLDLEIRLKTDPPSFHCHAP